MGTDTMYAMNIDTLGFPNKTLFNITYNKRVYTLYKNGTRIKVKKNINLEPCTVDHFKSMYLLFYKNLNLNFIFLIFIFIFKILAMELIGKKFTNSRISINGSVCRKKILKNIIIIIIIFFYFFFVELI